MRFIQEQALSQTDTTAFADSTDQATISGFELITQAQGFEWPIFSILAVGIFVLSTYVYRQLRDRKTARTIKTIVAESTQLTDLIVALQTEGQGLYHRIARGILKTWESGADASSTGAEVQAQVASAHAAYMRTHRIITFLSSAAGGLGLLGTLVGIYLLFSTGSRSPEVIFGGISLAIVSTLLGIVVSIILELLESMTHSWVSSYHEEATEWGDDIRFQLSQYRPEQL